MQPKSNIRQRFIVAKYDTLVIETTQTESLTGRQRLRIIKLKGIWRSNSNNELVFEATTAKGPPEIYTFRGTWKVNKNQQIEYTSKDGADVLNFKGYWQLPSQDRLVYILEGSANSRFDFKVQLESSTLYPAKGQIRYRIGIGTRKTRLTGQGQAIVLYGEWKFGRNLGVIFQMDYGGGKLILVEFGATVIFGRNKFILALKNDRNEPLGITLTITHRFLKAVDGQAFIRLKSRQNEQTIEAGLSIPF